MKSTVTITCKSRSVLFKLNYPNKYHHRRFRTIPPCFKHVLSYWSILCSVCTLGLVTDGIQEIYHLFCRNVTELLKYFSNNTTRICYVKHLICFLDVNCLLHLVLTFSSFFCRLIHIFAISFKRDKNRVTFHYLNAKIKKKTHSLRLPVLP